MTSLPTSHSLFSSNHSKLAEELYVVVVNENGSEWKMIENGSAVYCITTTNSDEHVFPVGGICKQYSYGLSAC